MNLLRLSVIILIGLITSTKIEAQEITIQNKTGKNIYIATAYYRPFLQRIDTDFPVTAIQEIKKDTSIMLPRPAKKGFLKKDRIIIFSSTDTPLRFINSIHEAQKELVNKKDLEQLEKLSKKKLEKITFKIIDDKKNDYIITAVDLQTAEQKIEYEEPEQQQRTKKMSSQTTVFHRASKQNNAIETNPQSKNKTTAENAFPSQSAVPKTEPALAKKVFKEKIALEENKHQESAGENTQKKEKEKPSQKITHHVWEALGKLGKKESFVINGTGKIVYIKTTYSGKQQDSDPIKIDISGSQKIENLSIRYGQWRYLEYHANKNEQQWKKKWMWPASDVYVIDPKEKLYTYNYTTRGIIVTKDVSVDGPVYMATYHYIPGKGALRTNPVLKIVQPEMPMVVPHITYTPIGKRQLAIANSSDSLAGFLEDTAYTSLVKKDISWGIGQKYMYIATIKNRNRIYDAPEWKLLMSKVAAPKKPLELSFVDSFIFDKFKKGFEIIKSNL